MLARIRSRRRQSARRGRPNFTTLWACRVRDAYGALIRDYEFTPNLRTNAGLDWQADIMGDYTTDAGTATASAATTLTDGGKAWTVNDWVGHIVVALVDVNTIRYGVVISNTATVLTVDKWYDPASPGGAAGSTPAAASKYAILPGGAPHWWMALSTSNAAPAAGDTVLAGEITTGGLGRSLPTSYTHTASASTYTNQKTFTASGTFTVEKEAQFQAQNGGRMPFESLEPNPPTLVSGDTLQQTVTTTI